MQMELDAYRTQTPGASSDERFSERPKRATAAKSSPKPPPTPDSEGAMSEAAKMARLRRICEKKPSGKIFVPQELHEKWRKSTREEKEAMIDVLENNGWDKAIMTKK